jgi:hypothetical protein
MLRFFATSIALPLVLLTASVFFYYQEYVMASIGLLATVPLFFYLRPRFKRYTDETAQDIYTLLLNQISNNHGENWAISVLFVLVGAVLTFIPYIISLEYGFAPANIINGTGLAFIGQIPNLLSRYGAYFFEFLNPTHAFHFIAKSEQDLHKRVLHPSILNGFWDFVGRVLVGYGLYQFVAAFRKHGKKQ